ncbi:Fur family transcriptional regulator [Micromonospora sp. SH-82]|uniref:Fur family transcriptional regulator n=1 Tax=Micromonospora sp. SH-82 TaxID=3132938 RepID=UPI003EBA8E7F
MSTGPLPGTARITRQRTHLIEMLARSEGFRSAQRLYADLRDGGVSIGLTTVYRILQALVEAGDVDVMRLPSGEQLFRRCSRTHHHHLICRHCARTVEITGPAVESWTHWVADRHGYTDVNHTLEIMGTCAACSPC